MVGPRHAAEPFRREHKYRFGGLKFGSRIESQGKIEWIDSQLRPAAIISVALGQSEEIPAINKIEAVDGSVIFACIRCRQSKKWIVLMAA